MILEYLYLAVMILILNIATSGIILFSFYTSKFEENFELSELVIYALGIGPTLNSLFLFYQLMAFPRHGSWFYILILVLAYTAIVLIRLKNFRENISSLTPRILDGLSILRYKNLRKASVGAKLSLLFLLGFFIYWMSLLLVLPITGDDMFTYAVEGKIVYNNKIIEYQKYKFDEKSGYFSRSNHPPGFKLLAVVERMVDDVVVYQNDIYFRSVTGYFGLLMLLSLFYWFAKVDLNLALIGAPLILLGFGFFITITKYHLDSFRIFHFLISTILVLKYIRKPDKPTLYLFGIYSGFENFSHSIGFFTFCVQVFVMFLFTEQNIIKRLKSSMVIILFAIFFGGIHYIMEILYGDGWVVAKIIKVLKNYF